MFPNSTTLVLAGSWNSSPGERTMNKITATTTGPQSALISLSFYLSMLIEAMGMRNLVRKKRVGLWREEGKASSSLLDHFSEASIA
ncbi:hypothetical protein SADUNF_Sadunf17G0061500 [Salix dunnii]|uniref:Uncharacterized protein n=1 Tax=Salix dunnii TaxID=1413687 RepID=A0A835J657_9ROSI|nr:hypothetical protein SADUNF_Sadunf17G0061500 [Salix dunnii]